MSKPWSKRHASASPTTTSMPPATPQPKPEQHQQQRLRRRQHEPRSQSQPQPQSQHQPRRMTSFTQLFRSGKSAPVADDPASQHHRITPVHTKQSPPEQPRPRAAYVPTHAAASFARTVSPLSRTRIDERDELESETPACEDDADDKASPAGGGLGSTQMHSTSTTTAHAPDSRHPCPSDSRATPTPTATTTTTTTTAATTTSPRDTSQTTRSGDYAAFLAEAQVNDRAFRTRWAQREKEREREWAASNPHMAGLPPSINGTQAQTQRDSAYYSVTSASPSSVSGSRRQQQASLERHVPARVVPSALPATTPARTLAHKPSRTLGRRISEYFKPTPEGGVTAGA